MCSHYQAERNRKKLERMGVVVADDWRPPEGSWDIYPTLLAPIIRRPPELESGDDAVPPMELVPAHFGLLPGFAKDIGFGKHTYNARAETVAEKPSFKHAWAKARHCIVPCEAIFEPDWRSGRSVPTRITRSDGEAIGIAGIWQPWKTVSGGWVYSFAMLTINADTHPLFNQLHKPDPKLPPDKQDKRMPVILNEDSYEAWLDAPVERSMEFMRQFSAERLEAAAMPLAPNRARGGHRVTSMNRYLFLDFDGVLHTSEPPRDLRFAKNLVPIVAELQLEVVISSTWREVYSVQSLAQKLGDLGRFVIGKTPVWPSDDLPETGGRQKEIEAWLAKNATPAAAWVALDDDRDNYRLSCHQVFITDKTIGLNAEVAKQFAQWCKSRV